MAPWVSFAALAVGLFCLVIEVEKPLQAMMMWRSFVNFSSWMTIGAWLLFASIAVFFLSAFFSTPRLVKALKVKEGVAAKVSQVTMVLGAVLGLGVAGLHGRAAYGGRIGAAVEHAAYPRALYGFGVGCRCCCRAGVPFGRKGRGLLMRCTAR